MEELVKGDCLEVMKGIENNVIDMVFTSPPYADRRVQLYGGVHESKYVKWFLPIAKEIKRILKPTGSFFLNIKPHTYKGKRCLYVFDLVLALKKNVGFNFVDELCWTKNGYPGFFIGRFKNGFEPIYHFTKGATEDIIFNPMACSTPMLHKHTLRPNKKREYSLSRSVNGMHVPQGCMKHLKKTLPSNVIHTLGDSDSYSEKFDHPATFPEKLVEFFVKSYTNEGMIVLDPFMGSGTTGVVCVKLLRSFLGIEIMDSYFKIAENMINKHKNDLKHSIFWKGEDEDA